MKRYRYGLNSVTHNAGQIGDYTPLGYHEVVPGDSVSGKISIKALTAPTTMLAMNRCFYDVFAFYVPFRLIWSGFPDFLISGTGTMPQITDTFAFNFEKASMIDDTVDYNSPWLRGAYWLVWNTFFRRQSETEAGLTDAGARVGCSYRPSTFHESIPEAGTLDSQTIDTSGTSTSVDDIRLAFNTDQFNRVRQFYGDRYTDYLAAVGVKANWSITEDPELLAHSYGTMKYVVIDPTSTNDGVAVDYPAGRPAGYWSIQTSLKMPRRFFPEHGMVCLYAAPRLEQWGSTENYPLLRNVEQGDFWSPERDGSQLVGYEQRLWTGFPSRS